MGSISEVFVDPTVTTGQYTQALLDTCREEITRLEASRAMGYVESANLREHRDHSERALEMLKVQHRKRTKWIQTFNDMFEHDKLKIKHFETRDKLVDELLEKIKPLEKLATSLLATQREYGEAMKTDIVAIRKLAVSKKCIDAVFLDTRQLLKVIMNMDLVAQELDKQEFMLEVFRTDTEGNTVQLKQNMYNVRFVFDDEADNAKQGWLTSADGETAKEVFTTDLETDPEGMRTQAASEAVADNQEDASASTFNPELTQADVSVQPGVGAASNIRTNNSTNWQNKISKAEEECTDGQSARLSPSDSLDTNMSIDKVTETIEGISIVDATNTSEAELKGQPKQQQG